MSDQRTYPLLPDDNCLTEQELFNYMDGKMTAPEMHRAEKHLLDCEMCSDALEGFQLVKHREKVGAFFLGKISEEKKEEPKIIPLQSNRRLFYAIAASVVLILGITVVMKMNFSNDETKNKLADNEQKDSSQSILVQQETNKPKMSDSISNGLTTNPAQPTNSNLNEAPRDVTDKEEKFGNKVEHATELEDSKAVGMTTTVPATDRADEQQADQPVLADVDVAKDKSGDAGNVSGLDDESKTKDGFAKTNAEEKSPTESKEVVAKNENKKSAYDFRSHESDNNGSISQSAPASSGGINSQTPAAGATPNVQTKTDTGSTVANKPDVPAKTDELVTEKELASAYTSGTKLLDNGQAAASLPYFDEVLQHPTDKNFEDAQWKKSLALIELNRNDEAKVLLNEIVAKKGKYKKDAESKLKTL